MHGLQAGDGGSPVCICLTHQLLQLPLHVPAWPLQQAASSLLALHQMPRPARMQHMLTHMTDQSTQLSGSALIG